MIRNIENNFEIKLNFNKGTKDPSRIFHSFGAMLDGINNLDTLIADTINKQINSSLILDDIETGSIIAKLKNAITINNDNIIDNTPDDSKIKTYASESRAKVLDFIASGKSSAEEFFMLQQQLSDVADKNEIAESFNYNPANPLKLAETINGINSATKQLGTDEHYCLKDEMSTIDNITPDTPLISLSEIETALTDRTTMNESDAIYLIKKPDFLGDSAWQFKHGKRTIMAKIFDEEWLSNFKSGNIVVKPGDSLQVRIKQICKYNRHGMLLSETLDIIYVINVIHNT